MKEVKGFSSLFDYSVENKEKFGLYKAKKKGHVKAIEEADDVVKP